MSNVIGKGMEAYGKMDGKTHKRSGSETAENSRYLGIQACQLDQSTLSNQNGNKKITSSGKYRHHIDIKMNVLCYEDTKNNFDIPSMLDCNST